MHSLGTSAFTPRNAETTLHVNTIVAIAVEPVKVDIPHIAPSPITAACTRRAIHAETPENIGDGNFE